MHFEFVFACVILPFQTFSIHLHVRGQLRGREAQLEMSSKPTTRSASKAAAKTSAHDASMDSPTPKSIHARRRKSAPAVTDGEPSDLSTRVSKGKAREVTSETSGRALSLHLDGLKDKLGEGSEDLTVKLHATVGTFVLLLWIAVERRGAFCIGKRPIPGSWYAQPALCLLATLLMVHLVQLQEHLYTSWISVRPSFRVIKENIQGIPRRNH